MDRRARLHNQARLRHLARAHSTEVEIFSAHDPAEFDAMHLPQAAQPAAA